ncbi:LOW QUALITY PROTEIN: uncharacterized protein ACR2FA_007782 [Aphomia sociella]
MSRDQRKDYYRDRDRDWGRPDYRGRIPRKRTRSRSPPPPSRDRIVDKRRSRSPRKNDKDLVEILNEISKLPEPSELWDGNQFQEGGFSGPPGPTYPPGQQEYGSNYQPSYSGIYDEFPTLASVPQTSHMPDMSAWNQMSLPPPPQAPMHPPAVFNVEDQIKKEAAIESEMRHQKAALSKQREDYIKKASILKKELDTLKDQRNELHGDPKRSPSPDTKRFLKENTKLQLEIQNKLKTINNVVDMLNGIIGEEAQVPESEDSERTSKRKSRSPSNPKFNYVYYDPEMHWCRVCNEFPPTAKDYLNHLHSPSHHKMAAAHMEAPWHSVTGVNEGFPSFPSAPTKRTPIRGLQFFVPSTAWYCKLCDQFIGDLHCASAHLKSILHSKNYINFVEQNPHWETDWMSDRQKSFEKSRASKNKTEEKPQYAAHTITFNKDGFHTKRKDSPTPTSEGKKKKKDKKKKNKKKRSSSSSSSSNSSSSDSEPVKKKKPKSKKDKSETDPDEKRLTEWMSSIQMDMLNESDRELLHTLKSKIKTEKLAEKRQTPDRHEKERYIAEIERKNRESERESRAREERNRRDEVRRRDERREERREDRREERRDDRREERRDDRREERRPESRSRSSPSRDAKKPEVKKMPFIGKMPVYKHLGKNTKMEEQKKEELKKKEEEGNDKKRREEMDAEIQKKVAEFKEKIAKAQLERERQQADVPPPALALPTQLGALAPPAYVRPAPAPAPTAPPAPAAPPAANMQANLPKDFQEALDIIFPSEVKPDLNQQDLFTMPGLAGFPIGMPPFPGLGILGQAPMPPMFGFDINGSLFPRPQLYDTHVPIVPNANKQRHKNNKKQENKQVNKQANNPPKTEQKQNENRDVARKKEELDDLAMLGIDASDVGAGI